MVQEGPSALAKVSELVRCPAEEFLPGSDKSLSLLPTVSSDQPEGIRDQKCTPSKAHTFFTKTRTPQANTTVECKVLFDQPSGGGGVGRGGGQLSTLLRICREFCAAEDQAGQNVHKVLFCCPFQAFIHLYY